MENRKKILLAGIAIAMSMDMTHAMITNPTDPVGKTQKISLQQKNMKHLEQQAKEYDKFVEHICEQTKEALSYLCRDIKDKASSDILKAAAQMVYTQSRGNKEKMKKNYATIVKFGALLQEAVQEENDVTVVKSLLIELLKTTPEGKHPFHPMHNLFLAYVGDVYKKYFCKAPVVKTYREPLNSFFQRI
ncbi:MAG: hypothetical protein LBB12_02235, partial [Holosporaceae bacterium]|nr:hypothetical protein [Holosporaceae bacterium]